MIDAKVVQRAVDALAMLKFFPSGAAPAIAGLLGEMCSTDEQVEWLARRTLQLYNEWPGPNELRAVLCARYKPADGVEAFTQDGRYIEEGIPSERPALVAPSLKALPSGAAVSAAPSIDAAICDLARMKDLNGPRRGKVRSIPVLPPGVNPITAEDIRRAVNELHERKAKEELEAISA